MYLNKKCLTILLTYKITNESSTMSIIKNGFNPVDETRKIIVDELIDDAILSVCFEVHRDEKIKHTYASREYADYERNSIEIFKQQGVRCYLCSKNQSAETFSRHLATCMGIDNTKRKASQKIGSFKESEDESDYSDSEGKPNSSKRKITKKGNNNRNKQSRRQGSSDNGLSYIGMTQEEKKAFLNQHCGVLAKRSKMPCKMNTKCARHSEEERRNVRNDFISDINDEFTTNEVIDVDSIDEGLDSEQLFMPS